MPAQLQMLGPPPGAGRLPDSGARSPLGPARIPVDPTARTDAAQRPADSRVAGLSTVSASPVRPDLLPRVAAGDEAAVAECVAVYGSLVWAIARRMALTPADAEDAAQEIFIDLWKSAARFDPNVASEAAFVTMIARRRAIDRRRRAQARGTPEEVHESLPSKEEPFDERIATDDEAAVARAALQELRPEQREVLELAFGEGLTHIEISAKLSLPLGTVKTHARRGLLRVRELLARASSGARRGTT